MTKRELEQLARAFRAIAKAIAKVDTDPADPVGGSLYPIISRLSSDADDGLRIVERELEKCETQRDAAWQSEARLRDMEGYGDYEGPRTWP